MVYSDLQKMLILTHKYSIPYMIVRLYGSLDVECYEQPTTALSECM